MTTRAQERVENAKAAVFWVAWLATIWAAIYGASVTAEALTDEAIPQFVLTIVILQILSEPITEALKSLVKALTR